MDSRTVWCELGIDPAGDVILVCGEDCTPTDAVELCKMVAAGNPTVRIDMVRQCIR
jgi:hypothetical protein